MLEHILKILGEAHIKLKCHNKNKDYFLTMLLWEWT